MPSPRTPLLWASLALNAFLIALVGAHLLRAQPAPGPHGVDAAIARMAAALPQPDAERFRAALLAQRPSYEPARQQMDAERLKVARAIGRTPFDEAAARQAMAEWRARSVEFWAAFGNAILVSARDLSPAGRTSLAALTEHPPARK